MSVLNLLGASALAMSDGLYYGLMGGGLVVVIAIYIVLKKRQS